jgi:mannose/fructose/N-acetylgalactosamine-specific phosphotransferase system component IIB
MSGKSDIKHRIDMLDSTTKLNAVEKSRKLKSLQVTENKLISHAGQLRKSIRLSTNDLNEAENQLAKVRAEREMLDNDDSPIVTEHAYLRYVERFMGIDLNEVHKKIMLLSEKDKVVHGRTVITVFTDPEDHFNLAERETK